jgi:DNA-binding NarL/FixJ family response regulator
LQMPIMGGLEAARQISQLAPNTAMLMFTMYSSEQLLENAHAAGIKDVVSKSNGGTEHLLASLRTVCLAA